MLNTARNIISSDATTQEMIAPVIDTLVATKAWSVGEEFIYAGTLYKVTTAIAVGDTIVLGSGGNADTADTITEQIDALHTVNQATVTWESGITPSYSNVYKNGNMARLNLYGTLTAAKSGSSKIATLPNGYVPSRNQLAIFMGKYNNVLQPCLVSIRTNGNIMLATGSQNFPSGDIIAFDTMYFLD